MSGTDQSPGTKGKDRKAHTTAEPVRRVGQEIGPETGLAPFILQLQRTIGNQAVGQRLRVLMRNGDKDAGAALPGGVATAPAPADPEAARVAKLNADYDAAVKKPDWPMVAELLNAYNADDIPLKLKKLSADEIKALDAAAVGKFDRVHLFNLQPIIAAMHDLAGWKKVAAADQSILDNMLGGATNDLSAAARAALSSQLPALRTKTDTEQAAALSRLITGEDAIPDVVAEQVATAAIEHTLTGPTLRKAFAFEGKAADAEEWVVKFKDGIEFPIVAPKAPTAGFHNHTVQEVADGAATLPKASRKLVTRIVLNAVTNPEDPHWAAEYKTPNFHSYMTAGAAGVVTIYPDKTGTDLPSANYMKGTMAHETGHTWSYKTWGEDETKGKWLDWKAAMAKDKVSVSGYAMKAIAEDVAETIQVYVTTEGSPRKAEYRKIVPARFDVLDKEYK